MQLRSLGLYGDTETAVMSLVVSLGGSFKLQLCNLL
jgi:hypothetical protein